MLAYAPLNSNVFYCTNFLKKYLQLNNILPHIVLHMSLFRNNQGIELKNKIGWNKYRFSLPDPIKCPYFCQEKLPKNQL